MISRRTFLAHSASALVVSQATPFAAKSTESVQAQIHSGKLVGERKGGVQLFRGVPFAKPPIGPLRFLPPQPVEPWTGVREALRFAPAPIQTDAVEQSEDCLYLNVWAPASGGPHPVFVWLYGGGFTAGRSSDPVFAGENFAKLGIVCITIAYRLGALGAIDMEPALGNAYAGSGNNALRDVIASLTWVQQNVAAFGGDPQRVTVGGQSAGAKITDLLLGVPLAAPLFHQAISESGGADRIWPRERSQEVSQAFSDAWTAHTKKPLTALRTSSTADLLAAQETLLKTWPVRFPIRFEIDGVLIQGSPLEKIRGGSTRGKRLLIGTNHDEGASVVGPHPTGVVQRDLGNMPLSTFEAVAGAYKNAFPEMTPELLRIRAVTAEEYWLPSVRVAQAHVSGGGTAFVYRFDLPGGGRFRGLSVHTHELRFIWNHLAADEASATATQLANTMHQAWANFILSGVPSAERLPSWPAYSAQQQSTMIFDAETRIEAGPQAKELALWDGLLMQ